MHYESSIWIERPTRRVVSPFFLARHLLRRIKQETNISRLRHLLRTRGKKQVWLTSGGRLELIKGLIIFNQEDYRKIRQRYQRLDFSSCLTFASTAYYTRNVRGYLWKRIVRLPVKGETEVVQTKYKPRACTCDGKSVWSNCQKISCVKTTRKWLIVCMGSNRAKYLYK